MRKLLLLAVVATLAGCSSQDYVTYAETQRRIAEAQAMSETARYAALAEIAKAGDGTAKVAAVISINMAGNGGSSGFRNQPIAMPESIGDKALKWTAALFPSLTQFYSINANRQIAITQSNNATAASISNNQAMQGIANSGFTAATTIASHVQAPGPVTTTNVGGNYNNGTNSGNSGLLVNGGTLTNSTATPTVITVPSPIVVPVPSTP